MWTRARIQRKPWFLLCLWACAGAQPQVVTKEMTCCVSFHSAYVGLAKTIYIQCVYGIFGRKITKYTGIYGVYKSVLYKYGQTVRYD